MKKLLPFLVFFLMSFRALHAQISFGSPVSYGTGSGSTLASNPGEIVAADFDNDGKPDFAVANMGSSGVNRSVAIHRNNGTGTFATPLLLTNFPFYIATGYFNGDNKIDLVIAGANPNQSLASISVFINTTNSIGAISFAAPVHYPVGSLSGNRDITTGKFNSDTYDDIALTNPVTGQAFVFINNGVSAPGTFPSTPAAYTVGTYPQAIASGDINKDGISDLIVGNTNTDNISLLLGSTSGTFAAAVNYGMGDGPRDITIGNFNNDIYPDVAVINGFATPSNTISVRLGSASGTLGAEAVFTAGYNASRIVNADFNKNGTLDLAFSTSSTNVAILQGNGAGGFAAAQSFSNGSSTTFGIATADFNSDTKPDLVTTYSGASNVVILMNTSIISSITTGTTASSSYCAGSPIVVPYSVTGTFNTGNLFKVQLSDVSGSFASPTNLATLVTGTNSITAGIPNGLANSSTYRVRIVSTNPVVNGTPNPTNLTISSSPVPAITISTTPDPAEVCASQNTVTMTASSTGTLTYTWSPAIGLNTTTGATVIATPTTTTTYTVKGSNGICSRTTTVTITVYDACRVAMENNEELNKDNPIQMYPNPVADQLTIRANSDENGLIQLSTMQGKVLREFTIDGKETKLDVSSFPKNMYIVHMIQGKSRYSQLVYIAH